jgi:hypothetical protein
MIRWVRGAAARPARAVVDRLDDSRSFWVLVGLATIAGSLLAAYGIVHNRAGSGPGPSTPAVSERSPSPGLGASPASATIGACLDSRRAAVPCTSAHRYEVVAAPAPTCAAADAIQYLGGHPARDMLLAAPVTLSLPGQGTVCAIAGPNDETTYATARGALGGEGSARWRRCLDERVADDAVPCSRPHTGEFIGANGVVAPDAAQCRAAAEVYMGLTLDRVSDRLAVAVVKTQRVNDGRPRCFIRVLGNDLLTDTLRAIGARALPIVAAE